jgi:PAS domain S-box-containing protein
MLYNGGGGRLKGASDPSMIVLIAPYQKLKETADSLALSLGVPMCSCVGDLGAGLAAAREALAEEAILVSRGGTAKLIRETLGVDVIEIGVSQFDLLRILKPFIGSERRIAVVGFRALTEHAENLCKILDIPAVFLPVEDETQMPGQVERLAHIDLACIVGDMVAIRSAASLGVPLQLIESGPDAVSEALGKAAIIARSLMYRQESEIRLRAVVNTVQEGIFAVDRDGRIAHINRTARGLLGPGAAAGLPAERFIPAQEIHRAMSERREAVGKVVELDGKRAAMDVTPIIVRDCVEGAVIVIQEVGKIQDVEKRVRRQLHAKGLFAKHRFDDILAESEPMRQCVEVARQYARSASSIVIFGETGAGKELLAQSIHNESPVRDGPFVAVNCGALPPTLLESELFGYAEGAFTGAVKGGKAGLFEMAHGGTIFLDEINALDVQLQNKLLRVLQEREVMRLGDVKVTPVSVRVLAACNVRLREEIARGRFRKDLFYRLSVLDISMPPLRERAEDIALLFREFTEQCARAGGEAPPPMPEAFLGSLLKYPWPGNVRELQNVAEKYTVLCRLFDHETAADLVAEALKHDLEEACAESASPLFSGSLAEIERRAARAAYDDEGGNLSRAAKRLGIDRQTLRNKLISSNGAKEDRGG